MGVSSRIPLTAPLQLVGSGGMHHHSVTKWWAVVGYHHCAVTIWQPGGGMPSGPLQNSEQWWYHPITMTVDYYSFNLWPI